MGKQIDTETRRRISSGVRQAWRRRKERQRVRPRDLSRLQREGEVAPSLRPLLEIVEQEADELLDSMPI